MALVRPLGGVKKRRLDEEGGSLEGIEDLAVVVAALGPRGSMERNGRVASGVPTGPRGHDGPRFGDSPMMGRKCNDPTIGGYNNYHLSQKWYTK